MNYDNFGLGEVVNEGAGWRCDFIPALILHMFLQHPTISYHIWKKFSTYLGPTFASVSTLHWPPHLRQSYHNSENFSTMWSPSHPIHSSTSSSTTRDATDFSTYTWLNLAPVCAEFFPNMIILCGCWRTFISFWKSSTHSWGQLELRLDWKVNSITSFARGGWWMKEMRWRSHGAEILWIMRNLAWARWSTNGGHGGMTIFKPCFFTFLSSTPNIALS